MATKTKPSNTGGFGGDPWAGWTGKENAPGVRRADAPEKAVNAAAAAQAKANAPTGPSSTGTGVKGDSYAEFGSDLAATVPTVPSTQTDINQLLAPYMKEMANLGTEYGAEMEYLKPYLNYGDQTFQGLQAASKADESPTGSKSLAAATNAAGQALENQQPPGFGDATQAAKDFEGTVPYSQILQDVLAAGKNQILGYSTVPNLTNINASQWPDALKSVLPYLEQSIGYTASGVPNPTTAGIQAGTQPGGYAPPTPNVGGGGANG